MHEMSIALSIIDAVIARAEQENSQKVNQVELEVGSVSGVLPESLKFCFSAAAKNTIVEGADLTIHEKEPLCRCDACGNHFQATDFIAKCVNCGSLKTTIISGRELLIKSITLD